MTGTAHTKVWAMKSILSDHRNSYLILTISPNLRKHRATCHQPSNAQSNLLCQFRCPRHMPRKVSQASKGAHQPTVSQSTLLDLTTAQDGKVGEAIASNKKLRTEQGHRDLNGAIGRKTNVTSYERGQTYIGPRQVHRLGRSTVLPEEPHGAVAPQLPGAAPHDAAAHVAAQGAQGAWHGWEGGVLWQGRLK